MLWLLLTLPLLAWAACGVLAWMICGKRSLPDFGDTEELKRRGWGKRAEELSAFRDWLAKQPAVSVRADSDDELVLRGTLVTRKNALGTVVFFHGARSSCLADFACTARFFYEKGYQLLLTDARAHGASGGRWTSYGLWERFDVRAWCSYCALRFPPEHPIFLYGQGMGAAAALSAGALDLPGNVRGILAEGAYTAPREILEHALAPTPLPAGAALRMADVFLRLFVGFSLRDPGAEDAVREENYPVLLLHGLADRITPPDMARRLFSACAGEKELLTVEGGTHARCRAADPEKVDAALSFFLDAYRVER